MLLVYTKKFIFSLLCVGSVENRVQKAFDFFFTSAKGINYLNNCMYTELITQL